MSTPRRPPELTTAQAARIAGVRPGTVRMWIMRGHVNWMRPGYVDSVSLLAYLDTRGSRGQRKGAGEDA